MTVIPHSIAYINHTILELLSKQTAGFHDKEHEAMQKIWDLFLQNHLRLVTDGNSTELDIILWLNRSGCCISDTLMAMEAIEFFEEWGVPDPALIDEFKQIIDYFEQLEILPSSSSHYTSGAKENKDRLLSILRSEVIGNDPEGKIDQDKLSGEDITILKQCLAGLDKFYDEKMWSDLRRVDYRINWKILSDELSRYGIRADYNNKETPRVRNLFGLLTRAIALCKKSSPSITMTENHIDFILGAVIGKYTHPENACLADHILHCFLHNIKYFLTVGTDNTEEMNRRIQAVRRHRELYAIDLQILKPSEFEAQLR